MSSDGQLYRRMQVKVLYSFDNSPTVFLSRSKTPYPVKVAQIPIGISSDDKEELLTLGAFDLKSCAQQIVKSSPENFKLQSKDYAVYYKDVTEQPDEPFVASGVMSSLLTNQKQNLIPGRVCQNLSASFLFGDKANSSSLTLEVRLKLHVIDKEVDQPKSAESDMSKVGPTHAPIAQQMMSRRSRAPNYSQSSAMKATRTKSLPIFIHPPNQQISNIINADKLNAVPKYDSKSILERFNLAPFLLAKIIDKPARKRRRSNAPLTPTVQTPVDTAQPQRAIRTRSMVTSFQPMVSSPINEDALSSDDTEYNEHPHVIDEENEEDFDGDHDGSSSPYMEQHSYKQIHSTSMAKTDNSTSILSTSDNHFQSLPDLEDLDSKKTHTIPSTKLPENHDLVCINKNCATNDSVTWRYFETKFHPSYLNIQTAKAFDKSLYDGMFGPLCNACYLFLRNKGFMRPEAVVKKYLQQQRYKKDLKSKEDIQHSMPAMYSSSPPLSRSINQHHKFATPTHAPSTINEVIRNQNCSAKATPNFISGTGSGQTPTGTEEYQDLNDFMNQLNSFGGPLTDIDIPNELQPVRQESTPPMMATKSNTRVINLGEDEEDKENLPPSNKAKFADFDQMMIKSFSLRSSPNQNEWAQFFEDQTPKDTGETSAPSNLAGDDGLPPLRTFKSSPSRIASQKANVVNMPSSPLLTHFDSGNHSLALPNDYSPSDKATRTDTTMSYVNRKSSPRSEIYIDDLKG